MNNDNITKYFSAKNILFAIGVILFLILIAKMQDIAIMFFASFVIACSFNPIVDKLSTKYNRNTSSGIVLGTVIFIIALFFVPLIILAGREISAFAVSFPQYLDSIKEFAQNSPIVDKIDIAGAISSASGFTSDIFNNVIDLSKNVGSGFVYLIASIIIIYYLMADKIAIRNTYLKLFPVTMREKALNVLDIISEKIGGYIVGQVTAMASVGIIMTIGLLILRVDYAVLLGLITAILDIIPIVGPAIALLICFVAAYKTGPVILALIAVVFAIAQLAENNFVKPYVFGKLLNIHPIIIYLFLFITAKYMGVIGVIFAPAIAATVCVLIQELYMKNLDGNEQNKLENNE